MLTYRVKLRFKGPIHIGYLDRVFEVSDATIHADTIFSGLINSYNLLFGSEKTKELLGKIDNSHSELLLSSTFFYVGDKYFLPKPKGETFGLENKIEQVKKIKKIKFVEDKVLLENSSLSEENIDIPFILSGKADAAIAKFYEVLERPRVMVARDYSQSNLFYFSEVHFKEGSGLWFYLKVSDDIEKEVLAALKLLSDEGIGGDRTYGFGQFEYDLTQVNLPEQGENYLLLSPYIPDSEDYEENSKEITKLAKAYELRYRTGYIHNSDKKAKRVTMFAEGSVFTKPVKGKILDVTPDNFEYDYRIYRYGKAFLLPFKGGTNT
ncbi:type III-A CRISPR-associated RAMP protein Csm4 [Fervidobacterium nodosum]|uniref:CRISPR system Cms protein Csm4 n=1 Tax=Fervidobacterium nodosum (strain ATCC 35602 / DSM 5306 / Rt17-B1) TaxID=381764 RepID=A7HMV4_FERNB|nr:type III-A CRISPR-associated RAMP protein Csm4 [Fervidobacterium nodosum]ABS61237.1 CRISPR-associated RAMP protein, Csm4 family [Fervidobacterium nodosum Rt17-B1]